MQSNPQCHPPVEARGWQDELCTSSRFLLAQTYPAWLLENDKLSHNNGDPQGSTEHVCFSGSRLCLCISKARRVGGKGVRKRKAQNLRNQKVTSVALPAAMGLFLHPRMGHRAYVVISNTASSWPRQDYMWHCWNQNISAGNRAGGLLIVLGIQSYNNHLSLSQLPMKERSLVPKQKTLRFQKMNKTPYKTMPSLWYSLLLL